MRVRRVNFAKTATGQQMRDAACMIANAGGCIVHEWPSTNWRVYYDGRGWS